MPFHAENLPPPDDDVISYGTDLNTITKDSRPALHYVTVAHTHKYNEERCVETGQSFTTTGRTDRYIKSYLRCT